jgi:hypothetical protein
MLVCESTPRRIIALGLRTEPETLPFRRRASRSTINTARKFRSRRRVEKGRYSNRANSAKRKIKSDGTQKASCPTGMRYSTNSRQSPRKAAVRIAGSRRSRALPTWRNHTSSLRRSFSSGTRRATATNKFFSLSIGCGFRSARSPVALTLPDPGSLA